LGYKKPLIESFLLHGIEYIQKRKKSTLINPLFLSFVHSSIDSNPHQLNLPSYFLNAATAADTAGTSSSFSRIGFSGPIQHHH